jgi:hypothetical protein
MTTPQQDPAHRLTALLETLPAAERQEITAWLFNQRHPAATERAWAAGLRSSQEHASRLTSTLASGEETQLVGIRLPADRHAQLREWCTGHGFTMAAVVRGLVDRFLDQQYPAQPSD